MYSVGQYAQAVDYYGFGGVTHPKEDTPTECMVTDHMMCSSEAHTFEQQNAEIPRELRGRPEK